jgi:hypothetical protein
MMKGRMKIREPRLIVAGGAAVRHNLDDDDVGIMGKNSMLRGAHTDYPKNGTKVPPF